MQNAQVNHEIKYLIKVILECNIGILINNLFQDQGGVLNECSKNNNSENGYKGGS